MCHVPAAQWRGILMMNIFWHLLFQSPVQESILWVSNNLSGPSVARVALYLAAVTDCTSAEGLHADILFTSSNQLCCRSEMPLQISAAGDGEGLLLRRLHDQWSVHLT